MKKLNENYHNKATDNKVGVCCGGGDALQNCLKTSYYAVSSVGEETTMKARAQTYQIEPDIAIAVDVTFTATFPCG